MKNVSIWISSILKRSNVKIIVVARGIIVEENENNVLFDYVGSIYPDGLKIDELYYFNEDNIDEVVLVTKVEN